MKRADFVALAGGVFESAQDYDHWNGSEKYENFWAFFFATDLGWVRSVYGDIRIDTLYQKKRHSIEHIIPKSFLRDYLRSRGKSRGVRYGAQTNPLNFLAAERDLNSARGNRPFDMEGDRVVRAFRIPLNPSEYGNTGLDDDTQWVIPSRSRGDIARAILYMVLVYDINELYDEHLEELVHWAKIDSPTPWEVAYNNWIRDRLRIHNPFITDDLPRARQLLEDRELLRAAMLPEPPQPTPPVVQPPVRPGMTPRGLKNGYAVLRGKVHGFWQDRDDKPHMHITVQTGSRKLDVAVNVRSSFAVAVEEIPGSQPNDLLVLVDEDYSHPITETIRSANLSADLSNVESVSERIALDYIRGNLFSPPELRPVPAYGPGDNDDLFERLQSLIDLARTRNADVYVFGEPYPNRSGLHNVHMNQGSLIEHFQETDGVYQDGGLFFHFADIDRWTAVFLAFQSQCWHTDDNTGEADPEGVCARDDLNPGGATPNPAGTLVRIVAAMLNPVGHDPGRESVTLINLGNTNVTLDAWKIADRLDREEPLSGVLEAGRSRTIVLSGNHVQFSNSKGGLISLLDGAGRRVHGVSYTKADASREGVPVIFVR